MSGFRLSAAPVLARREDDYLRSFFPLGALFTPDRDSAAVWPLGRLLVRLSTYPGGAHFELEAAASGKGETMLAHLLEVKVYRMIDQDFCPGARLVAGAWIDDSTKRPLAAPEIESRGGAYSFWFAVAAFTREVVAVDYVRRNPGRLDSLRTWRSNLPLRNRGELEVRSRQLGSLVTLSGAAGSQGTDDGAQLIRVDSFRDQRAAAEVSP